MAGTRSGLYSCTPSITTGSVGEGGEGGGGGGGGCEGGGGEDHLCSGWGRIGQW